MCHLAKTSWKYHLLWLYAHLWLTLSAFLLFLWLHSCLAATYGNTSKCSKNTPCLPGGNQEVVCRDLRPLVLCWSAVEARCNNRRAQTITPGVSGKHLCRASTHTGLLFGDLHKMYKGQSAALWSGADHHLCYAHYHLTCYNIDAILFWGVFLNICPSVLFHMQMPSQWKRLFPWNRHPHHPRTHAHTHYHYFPKRDTNDYGMRLCEQRD